MKLSEIYSSTTVGIIYLFLQIPALSLAIWSFKLNKDFFNSTQADSIPKDGSVKTTGEGIPKDGSVKTTGEGIPKDGSVKTTGKGITKHEKGGILGAGVCMLGKFAGWLIIIQTLLSTGILFGVNRNDKSDYKKTVLGVVITNCILLFMLIIPATSLNPQLSIRTIPFYFLQLGVILYLFSIYFLIKDIKKEILFYIHLH